MYSRTIPDPTLQAILDWSVVATDLDSSFGLDQLQEAFPDLAVAFVGEHTYGRADPGESGGFCIDLYDRSCGALITKVMWLTATLATALHSDESARIVTAASADMAGHLDRISALIVSR